MGCFLYIIFDTFFVVDENLCVILQIGATKRGRRLRPLLLRGNPLGDETLVERIHKKEGVRPMVSYPDLIQFVIMLTAFATFILKLGKRK